MNLSNDEAIKNSVVKIKHSLTPSLRDDFYEYALCHQTPGNKFTHAFGIPFIIISLLGLLNYINILTISSGLIFWLAINIWLFTLDWKLTIPFAVITLVFFYIGSQLPLIPLITLFALGWILQLFGHYYYEKRKPSFLTGVRHLVIGPLWLLGLLIKY